MAFDLNVFKSTVLHNGLLKPDLFRVRVFAPTGLLGVDAAMLHDIELWGEATTLPQSTIGSGDMFRFGYGASEKRPNIPVYQPWTVVFRVDGNGVIWRFFKNWHNLIVNRTNALAGGKYELSYKSDYLADMGVQVFETTGTQAISVSMIDAFPVFLKEVPLDWGEHNSYMRLNVTFVFTGWIES